MKQLIFAIGMLWGWQTQAQSIVGTWQLTDEKTCFQSEMKESETEKELRPQMGGSSQNSVTRLFVLDTKGKGKEGVFTSGNRKGKEMAEFKYKLNGTDLMLLDSKSGIMTRQLVVEELSATTLRIHDANKDCEIKILTRIR
ncbi:MAG TPA: hypothetical protein PLR06_01425 [Cyclobacteriaceae bacterium]|nr:hypothetical protein [Cyclobacteriaceae bacterium]